MATETQHDADLIARHIAPNPNKSGLAEAWLNDYGVSVWALIGHYKAVGENADITVKEYRISPEAMEAALAFYRQHKPVIDAVLDDDFR